MFVKLLNFKICSIGKILKMHVNGLVGRMSLKKKKKKKTQIRSIGKIRQICVLSGQFWPYVVIA